MVGVRIGELVKGPGRDLREVKEEQEDSSTYWNKNAPGCHLDVSPTPFLRRTVSRIFTSKRFDRI